MRWTIHPVSLCWLLVEFTARSVLWSIAAFPVMHVLQWWVIGAIDNSAVGVAGSAVGSVVGGMTGAATRFLFLDEDR